MNKKLLISMPLMAILTTTIFYLFPKTGITILSMFSISTMLGLLNINSIVWLFITIVLISVSAIITIIFSKSLQKTEMIIIEIISCVIAGVITYFFSTNRIGLAIMLVFYTLGLVFITLTTEREIKGFFSKIRIGWGAGKKITYALMIGSLIASIITVNTNIVIYKNAFTGSIMNVAEESIGIGLTEEQETAMTVLIESMPIIKSFLSNIQYIAGITALFTVLIIGELTIMPMTSFLAIFLRKENKENKQRTQEE